MGKHWDIAKEAYAREKANASKKMGMEHSDFLPAALEILEKPASPIGRFTIWTICAFFVIALVWSIVGRIDVVATARGKVVPLGQTKIIQSFEAGVVRNIYVENGDMVQQGEVLIDLDPTTNAADITRLERERLTSEQIIERNTWLLSRIQGFLDGTYSSSQAWQSSLELNESDALIHAALARTQLSDFESTMGSLDEQISERQAEARVSLSQIRKIDQTLPLLEEQVESLRELSAEGISSRFELLQYEENLMSRKQDKIIEEGRIAQIEASIRTLNKQKEQYSEQFKSEKIQELASANDTLIAVEQELVKARKTHSRNSITAPVTGVVQQLAIHTIGGVIRSGDPLMVVVPEERELQVEANVLNKDIGFVRAGMITEVKLDAFPFTKYGLIDGEVLSIDHDAVEDETLGLVYPIRVKIDQDFILVNGEPQELSPGMELSTEVKIGKRRIVEFVLSPLFRYKEESLRER